MNVFVNADQIASNDWVIRVHFVDLGIDGRIT
jgi:hypothetical protein